MRNLATDLHALSKCKLCLLLGCDHVPAEGPTDASVVIVGQSPGTNEAAEKRPFVGPSGELLDYMLDEAGLDRSRVYITNALKCHPTGNRQAEWEESKTCYEHWLSKELRTIKPKILVLCGKDAWRIVTKERVEFGHGKVHVGKHCTLLTVYHPAYFLRRGDVEGFVEVGKVLKELLAR